MLIEPCTPGDLNDWVAMREALWPDEAGLREGAAAMLDDSNLLALIARSESGAAAGFAEASIRRDYVNGCETSPVLFLEGIYIAPAFRRQGLARILAGRVGDWGRGLGMREFASDALLDNAASHAFHTAIGFAETERVVYFLRPL